ncbi:U32 family peptidase [Bradyrhizobium sediminis]|uniref:Ubiquinone biosynthesis protein UbiV n=1 Tax=Bradyrhizobium sediminis TaxID=2840469 RepID=A0A975NRK9_9BRAD|nr:U32 family peptidase [Bradyrhizobium sediminis]QWG19421.1 U32 family peptidase [Bradyrhizobium sediminis]
MSGARTELTLGPNLFNWAPETWRDFYFRIADEAPVSVVYLGEAICSKRAPLFRDHYEAVAERLRAAGKTVVHSTLGETASRLDRRLVSDVCERTSDLVEANDASAAFHLRGRPHCIGPLMNVYNEETLRFLAGKGARNICLPIELPSSAIGVICAAAEPAKVTIEVQVFGRQSLALSARCYHARAHGRTKDTCLFVCENDPDGLVLSTLERKPFLVANGVQTLSWEYLNLVQEIPALKAAGVSRYRLSPHSCDMVRVATTFRSVLDGDLTVAEALACLEELPLDAPFSNGFHHGRPGYGWTALTGTAPH